MAQCASTRYDVGHCAYCAISVDDTRYSFFGTIGSTPPQLTGACRRLHDIAQSAVTDRAGSLFCRYTRFFLRHPQKTPTDTKCKNMNALRQHKLLKNVCLEVALKDVLCVLNTSKASLGFRNLCCLAYTSSSFLTQHCKYSITCATVLYITIHQRSQTAHTFKRYLEDV